MRQDREREREKKGDGNHNGSSMELWYEKIKFTELMGYFENRTKDACCEIFLFFFSKHQHNIYDWKRAFIASNIHTKKKNSSENLPIIIQI